MTAAVFLDRDGTLIEVRNYISRPEDVAIFPGVGSALKQLQNLGFMLFIVSNQSGVGRGYFTLADVELVNQRLQKDLAHDGVRFEKIYIAPEAPATPSRGRKPSPQFLFDARDERHSPGPREKRFIRRDERHQRERAVCQKHPRGSAELREAGRQPAALWPHPCRTTTSARGS